MYVLLVVLLFPQKQKKQNKTKQNKKGILFRSGLWTF